MRRSPALLASKAARAAADRFFLGSKPVEAWLAELTGILTDTHGFSRQSVAVATSLDPTAHLPARGVAGRLAEAPYFPDFPAVPLGGLGGLPALGKSGFKLFRDRASASGRSDWLLVYGCSVHVNAAGEVRTDACAVGAAFEAVDAAGGIGGLGDDVFADKHDAQQVEPQRLAKETIYIYIHLYMYVCAVYSKYTFARARIKLARTNSSPLVYTGPWV